MTALDASHEDDMYRIVQPNGKLRTGLSQTAGRMTAYANCHNALLALDIAEYEHNTGTDTSNCFPMRR